LREVTIVIDSDDGLEARFTLERERGGVVEEPPFRMLVLGDWSGNSSKKDIAERRPIEVDRDSFDELIGRLSSKLDLTQPNGETLTLEFRELDDFHPDRIFERLPMFGRLRDLRSRLLSSDKFNEAAGDVRSWFRVDEAPKPGVAASAETAEPVASEGLLDAILSGSTAAAPRPSASGEVAALIKDLVRPHLVSIDQNEQSELLSAVDAATGDLMRRILSDKRFKALESAWRGLYLLVRRAETGTDLKIYILDISKEKLAEDLKNVENLRNSKLFKIVVDEAIGTPGSDPWAVIVGNYSFGPVKDDVAALMRIAKVASAGGSPFIAHMRPDVFGVMSLAAENDSSKWDFSVDSDAGKLWSVLRGIPEAEYVGMTIPRFLARLPYGRESEPLETFQFEEFDDAPYHDDYVWGNSCFIAALLVAQSFSAFGWQMDRRFLQDVEQLPMHIYKLDGETIYQPCAEVLLTQNGCERMMDHGLMPLVSYKNTDHVKLARFQSIRDPITGLRGRWSE
jgi:type VI secretion system protein ImpC